MTSTRKQIPIISDELYRAVLTQNIELINNLVTLENLDAQDASGRSLLYIAIQYGAINVVTALLQIGAHIETKHKGQRTALIIAVNNSNFNITQMLLTLGAKIEAQDSDGMTAACHAARNGDVAMIEMLLKANANPNHQTAFSGETPLIYAARLDDSTMLKMLLKAGARTDMEDYNEEFNALCHAIIARKFENTQLLLAARRHPLASLKPEITLARSLNQPATYKLLKQTQHDIFISHKIRHLYHTTSVGQGTLSEIATAYHEGNFLHQLYSHLIAIKHRHSDD